MTSSVRAVVGLDVGGTSSTVVVLAEHGEVLGRATGPGGNFRSSPGAVTANLGAALSEATDAASTALGSRAWAVEALTAGIAGAGPAGRDRAATVLGEAVAGAGLPAPRRLDVVTDPVVAYAAGAPRPDGALLLAGTGAVACRLASYAEVARCDGLGWLLGDVGSGVWLGLEGLRAAAAHLDGRGPATALTDAAARLAADLGPTTGDPRQDLVRLVDARSPSELGGFASAVSRCADDGDAVAAAIVDRAVTALLAALGVVADRASDVADVVLAGSVLTSAGPVRDGVVAGLSAWRVHDAAAPVVGALRLAMVAAGWPAPEPADLVVEVQRG
ncbi:N-acetylglucosamine kinase [Georgenia subflava]|uniref:N-acetylglucosamine kinase n=1 Tax=Georgenia subflava TaxID=1622177 RepID=UPI00186B48DF|nr:BadF/BadG/BcrA/BcrD ATPase family protein [Georgenia subflava]